MDAFNNSSAELNDWLSLLDHNITQRVRVGDLAEISDLTVKLKVSAINDFYSIYLGAILVYETVIILYKTTLFIIMFVLKFIHCPKWHIAVLHIFKHLTIY